MSIFLDGMCLSYPTSDIQMYLTSGVQRYPTRGVRSYFLSLSITLFLTRRMQVYPELVLK